MKDLLTKNLNPAQAEAVLCTEGPLIIFAGAGTGKTRVITHRIAYLLSLGITSWSILAITFTNKAAAEIKKRIIDLIPQPGQSVQVSTFHSFCAYFLSVEAATINLNPDFSIYDFADQKNVVKNCIKDLNIDEKKFKISSVTDKINRAKDDLKSPSDIAGEAADSSNFLKTTIAKIYSLYQKKLEKAGALDFGDLIMRVVSALHKYPDLLEYYQKKYKYIMVDEYQDTNHAQYTLIKLLAGKYRNICVVGDDDQCLPKGSLISTAAGAKKIEALSKNDVLLSGSGYGKTIQSRIENISKKKYSGLVVKVKTKSGNVITATPNHIAFAKLKPLSDMHYVYLTHKENTGYRICQSKGMRVKTTCAGEAQSAGKVWILRVFKDRNDAMLYRRFLSAKYALSVVSENAFSPKSQRWQTKQSRFNKTFTETDVHKDAANLMRDLNIFEEYPHQTQNISKGKTLRKTVNLNFFASKTTNENKSRHFHKISLNSSKRDSKDIAAKTQQTEMETPDFDEAQRYAKRLLSLYDFDLLIKARLTKSNDFTIMPFTHLKEGILVAAMRNDKIVEDTIEDVSYCYYDGFVYDIGVSDLRQFSTNGMIVHNSVYSWRGADINNILDFKKDYPEAKTVKLEQNYRSTPKILSAAAQVVGHNDVRVNKRLWTQNSDDGVVTVLKASNENDEAQKVADLIFLNSSKDNRDFSDFAVFYRTNAQSRVFEDVFRRTGIPYAVIGTLKFYDRTEVKDIVAYLKLIHNPNDNVSFKRIVNAPKRGVGKISLQTLEKFADAKNISLWQAVPFAQEVRLFKGTINALNSFAQLIKTFIERKNDVFVKEIAQKVITGSGYLKDLETENSPESRTKIENIQELISAIGDFEKRSHDRSLAGYLTQISLISDIDTLGESNGTVTLMTLHLAKGLEFDNVFICGLEEGLFPIFESILNPRELEEERRLMYVGMTRAKKRLYLCWSKERTVYGKTKWNMPSRFINEAGFKNDFVADYGQRFKRNPTFRKSYKAVVTYANDNDYNYDDDVAKNELNSAPSEDPGQYKIGAKVLHPVFGKGKIIEKSGSGDDLKLIVLFENGQWKKLLARIANLKFT